MANDDKLSCGRVAVLLLGPTASGKSALAQELAQEFDWEIVALDSAQVYQGLDIGSAKPNQQERLAVRHHLLDLVDPLQSFSVATMLRELHAVCDAIWGRARVPLIVGGTMLYARALLEGINDLPPTDPRLRSELSALSAGQRWQRLQSLDVDSASRLHPGDSQRVQRALEVYLTSGRSISSYWRQPKRGALAARCTLVRLALSAAGKQELAPRVSARLKAMLRAGWVEEVRGLRLRYPELSASHNSMRLVGYRRVWQYLEGELSYAGLQQTITTDTLNLAKRQLTWLRALQLPSCPWQQDREARQLLIDSWRQAQGWRRLN